MASTAVPTSSAALGRVLITGGCGFLGSHIVQQFLSRYSSTKTSVHVLDLRINQNTYDGATYHSGDLTDADAMQTLLTKIKPDVIVHTASPAFVANNTSSSGRAAAEKLMYTVNVEGTRTLLEQARSAGTRVFVYTSSASVISDTRTDLINADEHYPLVRLPIQREFYSDTKAEAETYVLSQNAPSTPFLTAALRPSAMFGEGDVQMIPNMLAVVRDGRTGFQLGRNENLFDFTYVGNVAHAHCLAAERLLEELAETAAPEEAARVAGEAFIITNSSPVYFWDFTRAVWLAYERASARKYPAVKVGRQVWALPVDLAMFFAGIAVWLFIALGLGTPKLTPAKIRFSCMTRFFKVAKAHSRLGYQPVWSVQEGIDKTVGWFWEREVKEGVKKVQ